MAKEIVRQINRVGNSFYVALPKSYLAHLDLTLKDLVVLRLHVGHISIISYEKEYYKEQIKCQKQS